MVGHTCGGQEGSRPLPSSGGYSSPFGTSTERVVSFPSTTYLLLLLDCGLAISCIPHWAIFRTRFGPEALNKPEDSVSEYSEMRHQLPPRVKTHGTAGLVAGATPGVLDARRSAHRTGVWQAGRSHIPPGNGTYLSRPYRVDVRPDATCDSG